MDYEGSVPNELLIRARFQQRWTQAELAEKVGTTFETVSRWERSISMPGPYYRRKLCAVFSKTSKELGWETEEPATLAGAEPSSCIFLSSAYADTERKFVVGLKRELQMRGITLWSSRTVKRQMPGRKNDVLQEAIRAAQLVLLIVSPHTAASYHVQETLRLARHYRRPICAVWVEGDAFQECLPKDAGELHMMIDGRQSEEQALQNKILTIIERTWLAPSNAEIVGLAEPMWKVPEIAKPLVGREALLAHVCDLLRSPQTRLLTLLGPGGIGKTHLSLQVAAELRERFVDGVCFVALGAISDAALVIPTIAKELGIRELGERSLLEHVRVALQHKHFLLVLDNFEHVLEAAQYLPELLVGCPNLKIVVTSRARLPKHNGRGAAEVLAPLADLALPLETLEQDAANALFLQRAQTAKTSFQLTATNAPIIARICTLLDGLPLAIELAAARIKSLSSEGLLTYLKDYPQLVMVNTDKDVTDRQYSLRNTIEWSYNLLDEQEKHLFRRLSVFVGSFSLEAIEAICSSLGSGKLPAWVGIESLLDKSLLQSAEQVGEGRFRLLETIHEYALERLMEDGEAEKAQQAHAEYYLCLVEKAEQHLKGEQQVQWLARLEPELGNLRVALNWCIEHQQVELALRFCAAFWRFWRLRGYWSEGRKWLKAALELSTTHEPAAVLARARALCAAGDLAYYQDEYELADALLQESVKLCRVPGFERELATALAFLGVVKRMQENLAEAGRLLDESEQLCRVAESFWELAYLLRQRAQHATHEGKLKQAIVYAQEGLALAKRLGDRSLIATTLCTLGDIASRQGDVTQAIAYNREALLFARELGDTHLVATTLNCVGYFTSLQGDLTLETEVVECLTLTRELGDRLLITRALHTMGSIAAHQGNLAQARICYREGLSLALELHNEEEKGWHLSGLALLALAEEQYLQAARLFGAVETRLDIHVDMNAVERAEYQQGVEKVRAQLGKKNFMLARSEGHSLTPEQVLVAPHSTPAIGTPPLPKYPDGLTKREVQVLCLLVDGLTYAAIGERLDIAERTVNTYITSIYRKIQVSGDVNEGRVAPRIAAVRYVAEHDLC